MYLKTAKNGVGTEGVQSPPTQKNTLYFLEFSKEMFLTSIFMAPKHLKLISFQQRFHSKVVEKITSPAPTASSGSTQAH